VAAAPLLSQHIIISGLKLKHHFGAIIKRSLDNVITAERRLYRAWSASPANSVPQSQWLCKHRGAQGLHRLIRWH